MDGLSPPSGNNSATVAHSTTQKTRRAEAYGSVVMTWSASAVNSLIRWSPRSGRRCWRGGRLAPPCPQGQLCPLGIRQHQASLRPAGHCGPARQRRPSRTAPGVRDQPQLSGHPRVAASRRLRAGQRYPRPLSHARLSDASRRPSPARSSSDNTSGATGSDIRTAYRFMSIISGAPTLARLLGYVPRERNCSVNGEVIR